MPSIAELKAQKETLAHEIDGIIQAAVKEDDRDLTEEERSSIEAKEQEIDSLDQAIVAKEASERVKAASEARIAALGQRRSKADSLSGGTKVSNPGPAFIDDPKKGFASHRDFLMAVMDASTRGYVKDDRLKYLATAGSDEQGTYSDPYSGFLLPVGFSPNVMKVMAESDPMAAYTTKIPMENAVVPINARVDKNHTTSISGGFTVYRRAETQSVSPSRQQYEQVVLNAQSLFGIAHATEELLDRSPVSFVALIEAGMKDEFGAKLIDERLNGTGVGMFEGIVNSPCVISVAKESGQAANTIVKENIDKMRSRCWGYGSAIWLYNHDCLPQLRSLVQPVGTGGSAVSYFQTDANGNSTLDGRPAFATEFTKTLGTVGDLVLGNWSQYLEGTLSPLQSAESMHVRFESHERTFKFWLENDGRCWWRSALTPKNSSNTLSPFVTLATRA
jgi:HK97 family phage major capsid protein